MVKFAGEKRPRETPDSNGIDLERPARRGFTPRDDRAEQQARRDQRREQQVDEDGRPVAEHQAAPATISPS